MPLPTVDTPNFRLSSVKLTVMTYSKTTFGNNFVFGNRKISVPQQELVLAAVWLEEEFGRFIVFWAESWMTKTSLRINLLMFVWAWIGNASSDFVCGMVRVLKLLFPRSSKRMRGLFSGNQTWFLHPSSITATKRNHCHHGYWMSSGKDSQLHCSLNGTI